MKHTRLDLSDSAKRFKDEMGRLGLKQAEFAKRIEMDPNTVSRWATGAQRPPGILWAHLRLLTKLREVGA